VTLINRGAQEQAKQSRVLYENAALRYACHRMEPAATLKAGVRLRLSQILTVWFIVLMAYGCNYCAETEQEPYLSLTYNAFSYAVDGRCELGRGHNAARFVWAKGEQGDELVIRFTRTRGDTFASNAVAIIRTGCVNDRVWLTFETTEQIANQRKIVLASCQGGKLNGMEGDVTGISETLLGSEPALVGILQCGSGSVCRVRSSCSISEALKPDLQGMRRWRDGNLPEVASPSQE
jgi:hypothetical protein